MYYIIFLLRRFYIRHTNKNNYLFYRIFEFFTNPQPFKKTYCGNIVHIMRDY